MTIVESASSQMTDGLSPEGPATSGPGAGKGPMAQRATTKPAMTTAVIAVAKESEASHLRGLRWLLQWLLHGVSYNGCYRACSRVVMGL